jgi:hypothetical protein
MNGHCRIKVKEFDMVEQKVLELESHITESQRTSIKDSLL